LNYIAEKMKHIDASGIRRIWQLAATMKDPVNFSIGEPYFSAPAEMKAAAIAAIEENRNTYTLTAGIAPLREALGAAITAEFGWDKPTVLVTAGLSGALTLAYLATINPGDEVVMADPYFVIYKHMTNLAGGKCVFVDTYPDFRLDAQKVTAAITSRTKLLILNSPANPTGSVYSAAELQALADVARKHDLLVVSDEIYRDFSYDGEAASIAKYYENTLVLRGYSKTYGVPGWRLGYVAAPEHLSSVVDQMTTLQQYTFVCAPHPFQLAAVTALKCDMSEQIAAYRQKRDMIYEGLKGRFKLVRPAGAFYAFVEAPGGNGSAFVAEAIKNDVLVIPGGVFSQRDTHFRISYATGEEMIRKGIARLVKLATKG
jgi:aspartate aminotransferase